MNGTQRRARRPAEATNDSQWVLSAEDLHISYRQGNLSLPILRGVTLRVAAGEAVGLVGESGSGKSTLARAGLGLLPNATVDGGRLAIAGDDVTRLSERAWTRYRGNPVAIVFQDPLSFLNPVVRAGTQIAEAVRRHEPSADARERVRELLGLVRLRDEVARAYPHQLSGGMRQRVLLAVALACRPRLLVADEPTTALDVTTQAEILELLRELRTSLGMALLMISHDLGVVRAVSHRVYVMYAGRVLEYGPTEEILNHPSHPYTQGLIDSAKMRRGPDRRFLTVRGEVPNTTSMTGGCPFAPRCDLAFDRCETEVPIAFRVGEDHYAHCWLRDPVTAGR